MERKNDESMAETPAPVSRPAESQVWFLSGDLMFASRVRAAAERAGFEFKLSTLLPEPVDDQAMEAIRYVILDLSTRSSLSPTIVATCDRVCPHAKLVAYGPHVQIGRLKAAREAGIPTVMTRGQFDQVMSRLFQDMS